MANHEANKLFEALTANLDPIEIALAYIQSEIASTITVSRIKKGLSQKELAQKLGVTQSLVAKWENGDCNYTMKTLLRLADALDIELQSPYVPLKSQALEPIQK